MKVDKTKETFNSPIFSFLQQLGRAIRQGSGKEIEKVMDTTLKKSENYYKRRGNQNEKTNLNN